MQLKQLERVLYFEAYIVIEPGLTPLEKFQLLTEDELLEAQDEYGEDAFSAGIGAEAVRVMLESLDLEGEKAQLLDELATTKSELKPKKIIKRLKVVESFLESGNRPERSEEHTSELQSLMRISYAVFCLTKKTLQT